jgi:hypothetical protein
MKNGKNRLFLYSGLTLLAISITCKFLGLSNLVWTPILIIAILLKAIFLINVFRAKEFKMELWITLILIGVVLVLVYLILKFVLPVLLLSNIIFYTGITLKISGLLIKIYIPRKK